MSRETYEELVRALVQKVGLPDEETVVSTGWLNVGGFEVMLDYFDEDAEAFYLNFHFGIVSAGRTLNVFRLLLESNLLVYAEDQAQMGLDAETGGIILIVRMLQEESTPDFLQNQLAHYSEHGTYWRKVIIEAYDEMYDAVAAGHYNWVRL